MIVHPSIPSPSLHQHKRPFLNAGEPGHLVAFDPEDEEKPFVGFVEEGFEIALTFRDDQVRPFIQTPELVRGLVEQGAGVDAAGRDDGRHLVEPDSLRVAEYGIVDDRRLPHGAGYLHCGIEALYGFDEEFVEDDLARVVADVEQAWGRAETVGEGGEIEPPELPVVEGAEFLFHVEGTVLLGAEVDDVARGGDLHAVLQRIGRFSELLPERFGEARRGIVGLPLDVAVRIVPVPPAGERYGLVGRAPDDVLHDDTLAARVEQMAHRMLEQLFSLLLADPRNPHERGELLEQTGVAVEGDVSAVTHSTLKIGNSK